MKYLRNSIFILFAFLCFFNPLKAEAAERNFWNHLTYASFILDESTGYNHDDAWCQIDSITCDDWGLYLVRNGKDLDAFVVSPEPFTATYRRWSYTDPVVTKASQYGSVYYLMIMGASYFNASYYTTTYPVFNGSYEDLLISIQNNQFDSFDNWLVSNVFDVDFIDIPRIVLVGDDTDGGSKFAFSNGAENLFVQIKGRWWSVDDIELYKESLIWKYRYSSRINSVLSDWVSIEDSAVSTLTFSFAEIGQTAFDSFLDQYPVTDRTYTGGTNALGNFFSGYNDALDMLQNVFLSHMCTSYVGPEIYCRYFYLGEDGNRYFSKWTHFYSNLARATGSSGSIVDDSENLYGSNQSFSGLTDSQFNNLENTGNSLSDSDLESALFVPDVTGIESYTQGFFQTLVSLVDLMGQVPTLFSTVYSWLPSFVPLIIGIGLSSLVILRFLGR